MTPIFQKLNYKGQGHIIAINAPSSFAGELAAMSGHASIITELSTADKVEFCICFVTSQADITHFISGIHHKLHGDATIWLCYPKSRSKNYTCDFNRDTGFGALGAYGLEGVRQVAIDDDWSALRFRKAAFIKKITRRESFAMTAEAKKRTINKGK